MPLYVASLLVTVFTTIVRHPLIREIERRVVNAGTWQCPNRSGIRCFAASLRRTSSM